MMGGWGVGNYKKNPAQQAKGEAAQGKGEKKNPAKT